MRGEIKGADLSLLESGDGEMGREKATQKVRFRFMFAERNALLSPGSNFSLLR